MTSPTLHVATVHWRSERWIDIQHSYLDRNLDLPFQVYASLEDIEPTFASRFDQIIDPVGNHADNLNALSTVILTQAAPTDLIMFLDGDAFPIVPMAEWLVTTLTEHPLVAVRRVENMGDLQPHPCFCVTTAQFWSDIQGDWSRGHTWRNRAGVEVTDVGGNLLLNLESRGIDWLPLLRSNTVDLHPVLFGIYGNVVYHHGAGFRPPRMRVDWTLSERLSRSKRPGSGKATLGHRVLSRIARRTMHRRMSVNSDLDDKMYARIVEDPEFFTALLT